MDLVSEIEQILLGIDMTENEGIVGWWETSAGADFGADRLERVIEAIERHTKQGT